MQPPIPPGKSSLHWPALIQLVFSLLAALLLFGVAAFIIFSVQAKFLTRTVGSSDPTESFMVASSLAFTGILVLPSAWYAWKQIAFPERPSATLPRWRGFGFLLTIVVFVLTGGALWLGNWVSQTNRFVWELLPVLNILATGLPALWVIYIGTRGLIPGMPRRQWGVFASGLILGPVVILVLELILIVITAILAIFWDMLDPNLASQLPGLVAHLQNVGPHPELVLKLVLPFVLNPGVIFLIFAFISILVPLLEEALKPIGVWFLAGQRITPAQGFGYGVLSGAGFGLFENLGYTGGSATGWALLASTRITTLLLHSFTAGLLGWALASAWSQKRYLRLGITYAVAVLIHGLWNGLVVLTAATALPELTNISLPGNLQEISILSSLGVVVLVVIVLLLYISANAILQRTSASSIPSSNANIQPPNLPDSGELPPMDEPLQSSPGQNSRLSSQGNDRPDPESELHQAQDDENSNTSTGKS